MADSKLLKLAKFAEEIIKCGICLQTYSYPKALRCLHTFCISCLAKILEQKLVTGEGFLNMDKVISITCPICNAEHRDITALNDLPTNFTIVEALDLMQECDSNADEVSLCVVCDKAAVNRCITCQKRYCHDCLQHAAASCDRGKEYGGEKARHMIVCVHNHDREEYRCQEHKIVVAFYCNSCEKPVCLDCSLTSHKGHETRVISALKKEVWETWKELEVVHAKNSADFIQVGDTTSLIIGKIYKNEVKLRRNVKQIQVKLEKFLERLFEKINVLCQKNFAKERQEILEIFPARKLVPLANSDTVAHLLSFVNSNINADDHLVVACQGSVLKAMLSCCRDQLLSFEEANKEFRKKEKSSSEAVVEMVEEDFQKSMVKMFKSMTLKFPDSGTEIDLQDFLMREFKDLFPPEEATMRNPQYASLFGPGRGQGRRKQL
eukprot:Seg1323.4 transcript_id=Seg1323.4/GoldUCD/mRNA.D3Y31 product="E3 ubiquitin-protein ligase TRIM33" protein_id=Seg1323.4/GoldUCD/D3Y31